MRNLVLLSNISDDMNLHLEERIKGSIGEGQFKLAYIPSQSDPQRRYFNYIKEYFQSLGVSDFLYFDADQEYDETIIEELKACDGVFFSGGNTFYFLKNLQERNLIPTIQAMVEKGKLLIGLSAGSIMMSKTIKIADYIDENIVDLQTVDALDLIDFEFMPHWDVQQPRLEELLEYSFINQNTIYTCYDGDGIVIQGDSIEFFGKVNEIRNGKLIEMNWSGENE
ncbi:Type 1 glutamine amidotransferase-like domain-containing protein [Neobacillus sp. PS2-9]|uniref:Type 1 glutamine amidotransferase-like domain-containing protein n=1 Tax=Neobacillus sp. PS2-9 TaxID=3070676 RepID=UPI0027E1B614|nr:Type 1 glutamine amidotransferase-like domain-containing protein [Neobacillus sp. PS2-9]WML57708.1 Type 1 glutamine amidotransferase-like domain-containing protein [Neobacillus sp. PS2-9]